MDVSIWKDLEWNRISIIWKTGDRTDRREVPRGKLKIWKKDIKTNFHGQIVLYDTYCNTMAVLKIDSVYKQGKNYHAQTCVQDCKYTDVEKQWCSMLSDDDGFFET